MGPGGLTVELGKRLSTGVNPAQTYDMLVCHGRWECSLLPTAGASYPGAESSVIAEIDSPWSSCETEEKQIR
jgi:hypothetical protein